MSFHTRTQNLASVINSSSVGSLDGAACTRAATDWGSPLRTRTK